LKFIDKLGEFRELDSDIESIAEMTEKERPNLLVSMVGYGTSSGFLVNDPSAGEPVLLDDGWWRAPGKGVFLFAFVCHSFEYVKDSDVQKYISSSLCYEGKLWLPVHNRDFWTRFIRNIISSIKSSGRIDHELYGRVLGWYSRAIVGRSAGILRRMGLRKLDYFSRIALVKQSESLKYIPGRNL
jgi:hypothetical protein